MPRMRFGGGYFYAYYVMKNRLDRGKSHTSLETMYILRVRVVKVV